MQLRQFYSHLNTVTIEVHVVKILHFSCVSLPATINLAKSTTSNNSMYTKIIHG